MTNNDNGIGFYSSRGKHGCFSNFSRHPITMDGKAYPTSEHYYQSKKYEGTKYEEQVRLTKGPKAAAKLGRDRTLPFRKDWNDVKDVVMYRALEAKFEQHPTCRQTLIDTGDVRLFEDSPIDPYWGIGKSGNGKNMMGVLLMSLRKHIRLKEHYKKCDVCRRMCGDAKTSLKEDALGTALTPAAAIANFKGRCEVGKDLFIKAWSADGREAAQE